MTTGRPSKYTDDMPDRAYAILAHGGTHANVCRGFGISLETFYQWVGRKIDKENTVTPYFKEMFSDRVKEGEVAGEAWVDDIIRKGVSEKFVGNPNLLIYKANKGKKISRYLARINNGSWEQRLDAAFSLYIDGIIDLEIYERLLNCLKNHIGILEKAKYEEIEKELSILKQQIEQKRSMDHS